MLSDIIQRHIAQHGAMTVADYMNVCLMHPEHGYYTTRAVFGRQGDFTTAPEISQLFGEIAGVWAMTEWERLGRPIAFNLVELGPGRGTLIHDLLRATTAQAGFTAACHIHFVEASERLQNIQNDAVKAYDLPKHWHKNIDTLPFDTPTILIANEFFDALPVRQFVIQNRVWHERVIICTDSQLAWSTAPQPADGRALPATQYQPDGTICEYNADAAAIFKTLCQKIKASRGAMLIVDYGDHTVNRFGDTLQAVKNHDYADILIDPGHADLTTHVDFYQLDDIATSHRLTTGYLTQSDFLKNFGITERVNQLTQNDLSVSQKNALLSGYQRLIDPAEMGELFKVLLVQAP